MPDGEDLSKNGSPSPSVQNKKNTSRLGAARLGTTQGHEGPKTSSRYSIRELLGFLFTFALLVSDTAAGLASRLARGLALTASAVLCAVAKISGLDSLNMFHNTPP